MNNQILQVVILIGAIAYLAQIVTKKNGPFNVLRKFRLAFGEPTVLTCPICHSFWSSILYFGLYFAYPPIFYLFLPFGAAGLALAIQSGFNLDKMIERDEEPEEVDSLADVLEPLQAQDGGDEKAFWTAEDEK